MAAMTDFGHLTPEFMSDARTLIADLDARVPSQADGMCRHCGGPVVFKPFFLDGKLPNPPRWFHRDGATTCATRPVGWRRDSWPVAEPAESEGQ